jgi:hypothetical protein
VPTIVEPHVERPPTIHILLELSCTPTLAATKKKGGGGDGRERTDGRLSLGDLRKLHNASTLGTRAVKQYFCLFDLAGRLEQLDKVFICR